jgi:hypothetical protein
LRALIDNAAGLAARRPSIKEVVARVNDLGLTWRVEAPRLIREDRDR